VKLSDVHPALQKVEQWEPSGSVADDWTTLCKLLKNVTGEELFDIGDKAESLATYLTQRGIQRCTNPVARGEEWENAPQECGKRYHTMIDDLLWDLLQKYECVRAVDTAQPAHVQEAMGQEALKEWAQGACSPHCDVANFVSAWKDGRAFLALLNHCYPFWKVRKQTPMERVQATHPPLAVCANTLAAIQAMGVCGGNEMTPCVALFACRTGTLLH